MLGTNNLKTELVKEASAKGVQVRQKNADDFANSVKTTIESLMASGKSLRGAAVELEKMGVKTARGGNNWTATAVKIVLNRAA